MNDETARILRKRAVASARGYGFAEFAEDIAQEVLLYFSEGRGERQTIDQAVIDAVRRMFGRPGTPGFSRKQSLERAQSIFDEDGKITVAPRSSGSGDHGLDFERITGLLSGDDRMMIILSFRYGLINTEIADLFEVTESRISQRLSDIFSKLRQRLERDAPSRRRQRPGRLFKKSVDIDTSSLNFDPDQVEWLKL
jgi:hypothetical protein